MKRSILILVLALISSAVLAQDVWLQNHFSPNSGMQLSNVETVTVLINNNSGVVMPSNTIQVSYTVNGGAAINQPLSANLTAGASWNFSFSVKADLSVCNTVHRLKVWVTRAGDTNHLNDTLTWNVENTCPPIPDNNGILYVKKNATGSFLGNSWADASAELADALRAARHQNAINPGKIKEIWVAAGTYKPLYSPADNNFGNPDGRDNAFLMVKDVKIYGGFAGTETALAQRDLSITANRTTLSGDFNDDDVVSGSGATLSITNNGENAYHVLISAGDAGTALLDGFTVRGGNANSNLYLDINGQGIFRSSGGGVYNINSSPGFTRVSFTGNRAINGGGMSLVNSSPGFTGVSFTGNRASNGGGMHVSSSSPVLTGLSFTGNYAINGGGVYNDSHSVFTGVSFSGNAADARGGAMLCSFSSQPVLTNCSFNANTAAFGQAVFAHVSSMVTLNNSVVWKTAGFAGNNNLQDNGASFVLNHTLLQYPGSGFNISLNGNSAALLNLDPLFTDADGADNIAGTADDNLALGANSPAIGKGDNALYEASDGNTGNNSLTTDKDLAGNNRLQKGTIDLGAYESTHYPAPVPDANGIIYVKQNGAGSFTGDSWANAAPELADALLAAKTLNAATPAAVKEIWIAGGTYKPLYSPADNNFGNPAARDNAFLLVKDVKVYGGFAGTETALTQRDLSVIANETVLSGDFNGDDAVTGSGATLSITGNGENAYHVLVSAGNAGTALLDGFTISGGNADQTVAMTINAQQVFRHRGGGLSLINGSPAITNLAFRANRADFGGALFSQANTLTIDKVSFSQNLAKQGGAFANDGAGTTTFLRCSFTGNAALDGANGYGGAIMGNNGFMALQNSRFTGNHATNDGGAIWTTQILGINSVFTGNSSLNRGGAIAIWAINYPGGLTFNFTNCSFAGNQSPAGPVFSWPLNTTDPGKVFQVNFTNSIVYNGNGAIDLGSVTRTSLKHNLLQESGALAPNFLLDAASTALLNHSPGFVDADGPDNVYGTADDDLSLAAGSAAKNAGDNTLYEAADGNTGNNSLGLDKDLVGSSRLWGTTIDLGAYEASLLPQSITAGNLSKVYGSAGFEPGATASSGLEVAYASADPSVAEAYQDALDGNKWKLRIHKAGTVTITASQGGSAGYDPAPDQAFTLTVSPKPVTALITASSFSKVYDGTPSGTLTAADLGLAAGSIVGTDQVQLALSSPAFSFDTKEAGTGKGVTLPLSSLSLSGAQAASYTLANTLDLTAAVGTISPRPLTVTANNFSKVYDGTAFAGGNGVSYSGFALGEDASLLSGSLAFGGSSQGATGVGTYPIVPSGLSSSNYAISYAPGQLTISLNNVNTLSFTAQTPGATVSRTYGDADLNAAAVASSGLAASYQSSNTAVAAVSASGQVSLVGTGSATITVNQAGDTNYGPASPISFTVQVAKKTLVVTANDFSKTYNGQAYSGGNGVSYSGFVNNEGPGLLSGSLSYGGSSQGAVNTGAYTLVPSGLTAANYSLDYRSGTLSIVQAGSNVLTFNSQVAGSTVLRTYGEGGGNAAATASSGLAASYQSNNTAVATVDAAGTILILSAGTTTITASQAGNINYPAAAPISFTLTVQKKALTVTANNAVKEYNGQANTTGNGVSYTGFIAGEDEQRLQGTLTYSGTAIGAKDVGSYFISPGGYSSLNYAISYQDGSLTITKASVTVRAAAQSKTYGDTDPALAYTSTGLIGSDTFSGSLQRTAGEDADGYLIGPGTLSAGANYTLLYTPAELTIHKALLTVTAQPAAMCQGSALPSFTLSYSGFKRGDGESSLAARPVVSTTATAASPAGTYTLTPAGAASNNYTFAYISSTLTVNALPQPVISATRNSLSKGESLSLTASGGTTYQWAAAPGILGGQQTASLTVRPEKTTTYLVTATSSSGCQSSSSITITVQEDFMALKPGNLLSPNGDGINDRWIVENIDMYPNNNVRVIDRTGKVVYTKRSYDNTWDGQFNGQPLPEEVYYYIIDFGTGKGPVKGAITLVYGNR